MSVTAPYRSDLDAAHARIAGLEVALSESRRESQQLREERNELRARLDAPQANGFRVTTEYQALDTVARTRGLTFIESSRSPMHRETSYRFRLRPKATGGFTISDDALEDTRDRLDNVFKLIDRCAPVVRGQTFLELLDAWSTDRHALALSSFEDTERAAVRCADLSQFLMGRAEKMR